MENMSHYTQRFLQAAIAAIALSGCSSARVASTAPTPVPDAWSVSVRCGPVKSAPCDLRCEATVKSLNSDDRVVVPPFIYRDDGKTIWYIPSKDSKGRQVSFNASRDKHGAGASWHLAVGKDGKTLLEYSGHVSLDPLAEGVTARPLFRE